MQKLVIVHFRDTLAKYLPVVWVVNHHFFILKLEICQAYRSENDSKGFLVVKKKIKIQKFYKILELPTAKFNKCRKDMQEAVRQSH